MGETCKKLEPRIIIKPGNLLVAGNVEKVRKDILIALEDANELEIDMFNVKIIDGPGVSLLISTHNLLKKRGNTLWVTNVCNEVYYLLDSLRLNRHFHIEQ